VIKTVRRFTHPVWMALTAAQVAWLANQQWRSVPPEQRQRLGEIVRHSHGDPRRVSSGERHELMEIARAMQLRMLARRTAALVLLSRKVKE
jgi:hypothetical protein